MESSQQTPRLTARQKLLIKFLAFLGLVLLLYMKPKLEAWVESRTQNQQTANNPTEKSSEKSSPSAAPWKKSEASEHPAAEVDDSEPPSPREQASETADSTDDADGSLMADAGDASEVRTDAEIASTSPAVAEEKRPKETTKKATTSKKKKSTPKSTFPAPSTKTTPKATAASSKPPRSPESDSEAESDEMKSDASSDKTAAESDAKVRPDKSAATASKAPTSEKATFPSSPKKTDSASKKSSVTKMDRVEPAQRRVPDDAEKNIPPPAAKDAASTSTLGKLKEIDDNVFESTAGLVYLPGSADGHRLRHVMEHAKDNTSKEIHGVYDGERDEILAVIDEAFTKAKKGGTDVRSEKQNGRRIYTVNLKRRIGQMGGQQGERQGNPECRYLRMVIENDVEVVTAYPTKSF